MVTTDDRYFTCPKCGWVLSFHFDSNKGKYVSLCPYCKDRLEIDKIEYENDNIEIYFEKDF